MTNPARRLHRLYSGWREALEAQGNARPFVTVVDPQTAEGTGEILLAARLLGRIDSAIDDLRVQGYSVDVFRRQFPNWVQPMVSFVSGWGQDTVGTNIVSDNHLDQLETLASFLDGKVFDPERAGDDDLRSLLLRVRQVLNDDDTLEPPIQRFIRKLVTRIENALDDDAYGSGFDYDEAVQELFVAFRAAEAASKKPNVWHDLWTSYTSGFASSTTLQLGTWVLGQIAGGS